MKMYHKLISNLEWALSCLSHPISLYLPNVEESKVKCFFWTKHMWSEVYLRFVFIVY